MKKQDNGQLPLTELRQRLLSERDKILALYREDVHAAREIQEEGTEDFEELAAMDLDRELLLVLSEAERERIQEIDDALERMADGTYGVCQQSGRPIDLARLREVPWARYCVEHQKMAEEGVLRV
jgi:RNA polymerase-binding transcription factor